MLILGRRTDERIVIADNIVITVVECRKGHCRLGITAPEHITVHRQEVYDAIQRGSAHGSQPGAGVTP